MSSQSDKRRGKGGHQVYVFLGTEISEEVAAEAKRLDRTIAWVLRKAWEMSRDEVAYYPDADARKSA